MEKLSHVDAAGNAKMVNVGRKQSSDRIAIARATVCLNKETYTAIKDNSIAKGDVLTVAKIAGIQGGKQTASLIPLCHPLSINSIDIVFEMNDTLHTISITSTCLCHGKTGVEMEALTACSVTALTIYDMVKAMQKDIAITDIVIVEKKGGKSGDYIRQDS